MTPAQLRQAYLQAQSQMEAHEARRDSRYHCRKAADETLGDRIVADKFVRRTKGVK